MFNNPFRERAIAASANRQQLDRLLRVTAPHERIVLAAVGLILAGIGAWILFGTIVLGITLDGVLLVPGQRYEVVAAEPGYFVEYLVEPGDHIEPGAAIARQTAPASARETAALRDRVEQLELEVERRGADTGNPAAQLAAARAALLQAEAQRAARQLVVSPAGGEIVFLRASPGEYLQAGTTVAQLRDTGGRHLQATLQVTPRMARQLRTGMRAAVEVQLPDGETRRLEGRISAVAAEPSPPRSLDSRVAVADSMRRVDIDLPPASDLALPHGTPCRIRIVRGRYSLALLLGLGSP